MHHTPHAPHTTTHRQQHKRKLWGPFLVELFGVALFAFGFHRLKLAMSAVRGVFFASAERTKAKTIYYRSSSQRTGNVHKRRVNKWVRVPFLFDVLLVLHSSLYEDSFVHTFSVVRIQSCKQIL